MNAGLESYGYLIAAGLFIAGIKLLGSARTARTGNHLAAVGMLIAILSALTASGVIRYELIIAGLVIGGALGVWAAARAQMTEMPQLVALLNGLGGGASALIAGSALLSASGEAGSRLFQQGAIAFATIVGAVTLTGSIAAYLKLEGRLGDRPIVFPAQRVISGAACVTGLGLAIAMVHSPELTWAYVALVGISAIFGAIAVLPIGGADMPVVISLLNSYSGIAACGTGFVLDNPGLVVSGALVGASGLILTRQMCAAMNRSLANVLFGAFSAQNASTDDETCQGSVTAYTAEDAAIIFANAQTCVVVPGFGLAVAHAQHAVKELADRLAEQGVTVRYAIHPVAGRMPGHMNVLLAEAKISYDDLVDMDTINPEFPQTDVVLVVGANDVVNPSARENEGSPIYGMPILDVASSRDVFVVKRSMATGFAGVSNPLFHNDNTRMLFGDAKQVVTELADMLRRV